MKQAVFDLLQTLIVGEQPLSIYEIEDISGYSISTFYLHKLEMRRMGWMIGNGAGYSNKFEITELGKIAYAIEAGRKVKQRAVMNNANSLSSPTSIDGSCSPHSGRLWRGIAGSRQGVCEQGCEAVGSWHRLHHRRQGNSSSEALG
jgi:hypothetical protein